MNRIYTWAVVICLWCFFHTNIASACQYNVREIGFVDLGTEPYFLFGFVNQETPLEITSSFRQISSDLLLDSNIEFEIINTNKQKEHSAMKYLELWSIKSFPAAVLVSPDGQSLVLPVTKPNQPFERTLQLALDEILTSPKREEILRKVSEAYGVVLLIEGVNDRENKMVYEVALSVIEIIKRKMDLMPKNIKYPPVLILLDHKSIQEEPILLWSLGLNAEKITQPHAAIIYGKARWIGPLFRGEEITKSDLSAILSIIGSDCECGVDIMWLEGTMLPLKWNIKMQVQVAKNLGFDPENPIIKMEVTRIMKLNSSYPGVPYRTGQSEIESKPVSEDQQNSPSQNEEALLTFGKMDSATTEIILTESGPDLHKTLCFLAGLVVLILAGGMLIVFRKIKKRS